MLYYKKELGDYYKKAGRLSILQHGVYNLLIDACYDRERFPTREEAIDWVWASSKEEIEAVDFILRKFFIDDNGVFSQNRIAEGIESYHAHCAQQAENGRRGGRPKGKPNGLADKPDGLINKPNSDYGLNIKPKKSLSTNNYQLTTNNKHTCAPKDADIVFDYWKTKMDKTRSIKSKDKMNKIKSRLKDGFTVGDLKKAVDGCKSSGYHMGINDDKKKYNSIELIFRNTSKTEEFIELNKNTSDYYDMGGAI